MGTSVLNYNHHLLPSKDLPQSSELNLKQKEQEFLRLLKKCKSLEEFKQVHVQILKFGLFLDSFKFEMEDIFGIHNLFNLYLHNVIRIIY